MKHGSSKRRVLIVDDNRDSAEILQMFLELHDYEIRVAFSGASGLKVAADFRPHVVCSDLNMPGVSGFDMASILRKSDHGRSTYLIAMTGMNTDENFHEAIQSGFDMCLMKPFEIQKLLVPLESKFSTIEK